MVCFNFYGKVISLQSSSKPTLQKIKRFWRAFYCKHPSKSPDVVFEISKFPPSQFRLFKKQYFSNPDFLFILDRQSLVTCHFDQKPWHVYIQYFEEIADSDRQSSHLAFGVFSIILRSILKRLGFFQLHSAAVTNRKCGVLFPGKMGSGKTTTALMMLGEKFKLVADDQVFLKKEGLSVQTLGFARDFFVTKKTVSFFPELNFLKKAPSIRKGRRLKKFLTPRQFIKTYPGQMAKAAKVNYIFFPGLSSKSTTLIRPMSKSDALARLLKVESEEPYPLLIKDEASLLAQLKMFSDLCEQAQSYDLQISKKDRQVAQKIKRVILGASS